MPSLVILFSFPWHELACFSNNIPESCCLLLLCRKCAVDLRCSVLFTYSSWWLYLVGDIRQSFLDSWIRANGLADFCLSQPPYESYRNTNTLFCSNCLVSREHGEDAVFMSVVCVSTPKNRHSPHAYYFQATFNVRKFDLGIFSCNISDSVFGQKFVHASSTWKRPVSIMLTKDYDEKQ